MSDFKHPAMLVSMFLVVTTLSPSARSAPPATAPASRPAEDWYGETDNDV